MYTVEMADSFHKIVPPKNFGVILYDNEDFITIKIEPEELLALSDEGRLEAVEYIKSVKKSLESFGALVLVVRDTLEESKDQE